MTPDVELQYIPRSFSIDPRVRVTIFRECGSAILEVSYATIAEICEPKSDGKDDLLQAFRKSIPELLQRLNKTIKEMPAGSVVFVTPKMLRSGKMAAA